MGVHYYIDELNKAVSIADVMKHYGLDVSFHQNVHCPSPYHGDDKPSAKIYPKTNSCHCFACSKSFTPISIVMEQEGLTLPKACGQLIKEFGLDLKQYADVDDRYNEEIPMSERFPLTIKELNIIHWSMGDKNIRIPMDKDDKHTPYYEVKGLPTLRDFYKERPKDFYAVMQDKCLEELNRQFHISNTNEDCINHWTKALRKECRVDVDTAKRLYDNFNRLKEENPDRVCDINQCLSKHQKKIIMYAIWYEDSLNSMEECLNTVKNIEKIARKVPISCRVNGLVQACKDIAGIITTSIEDYKWDKEIPQKETKENNNVEQYEEIDR